jgi:hypothetical protein
MIPYEHYKLLHIVTILLFFMLATASFYIPKKSKVMAGWIGILAFLILLGGMGLMARLGIARDWPAWTIGKVVVWFLLIGGAHMIAKRVPNPSRVGIWFLSICGIAAAALAIYKPGQ